MARGDIPIEPGYSWFTTKAIIVALFNNTTISTDRSINDDDLVNYSIALINTPDTITGNAPPPFF